MILQKNWSYCLGFVLFSLLLTSCLSRPEKYSTNRSPAPSTKNSKTTSNASILANYAQIIGVDPSELKDPKLYAFIDDWIGAPHSLGGQTKSGIDCSAFINQLVNEVYEKSLARSSYDMAKDIKRKYENQLIEGDLVFFSFGKKNIDHVGLYLKNNKFVHVSTSKGVMISDLHESWFYKYFVRAGSVK